MFEDIILPVLRQNIVPILVGSLGIVLILLGFMQILVKNEDESGLVLEKAAESKQEIVVDLEGALMNPGVYHLSSNSRMVDALAAAGGLSESADRVWVEKNINLAKKISDGLKIYIPREGEEVASEVVIADTSEVSSGMINMNSASSSELESLPGVGQVTAQKIIDGRPYSAIEDILTKKIVGNATYEKIKTSISTQ